MQYIYIIDSLINKIRVKAFIVYVNNILWKQNVKYSFDENQFL